MAAQDTRAGLPMLQKVDDRSKLSFERPSKRIHDGPDVSFFLSSLAYRDIMTFALQLNRSMVPRKVEIQGKHIKRSWPLDSKDLSFSEPVSRLRSLIARLEALISEAPPDTGPRRFGNVSFRSWYKLVEESAKAVIAEMLPEVSEAYNEIEAYLLGSFGSPQRLDYGTGHELSFLAFVGCLWKLDFFTTSDSGVEERSIVIGVFEPYFALVRTLIKTYTLEPAGSHGVWGLDDNSFLPYVFGSAQLCPAIEEADETPVEGSLAGAPDPSSVAKANLVEKERSQNLYFSAVAFIYEVKRGPFWEHSPMLYDISGIKDGWGKINKGMIKMYNAEVLSKFPVVQHFPFGSMFRWEKDPEAKEALSTTHTASQPLRNPHDMNAPAATRSTMTSQVGAGTTAPWARQPAAAPVGMVDGVTRAPWAKVNPLPPSGGFNTQRAPPSLRPTPAAVSAKVKVQKQPPLKEDIESDGQ